MKIGKRRICLLILGLSVVACPIVLVMTTRRPPVTVVEFTNNTGVKMKGVALSCDGIKMPPRELADGDSAWFKIDESKAKDVRILYLDDYGGRSESVDLTGRFNAAKGTGNTIHVYIGRGNLIAVMGDIQFSNKWTDFTCQSRIWFHRNF